MTAVITGRLYPSQVAFPASIPLGVDDALGAVVNGLALSGLDGFGCLWHTTSLTGFDGSPASSMQTTQKPRSPGAWPSPANLVAKTPAISGTVTAPDADGLQAAIDRLNSAATLTDMVATIRRGTSVRSVIGRRAGDVAVDDDSGDTINWALNLTCLDPRKFGPAVLGTVALPFSTGGITVPTVVPTVVSSSGSSGTLQLSNPGNATGPVTVRVDGPATGPKITNVTAGLQITLDPALTLAAGEFVVIDMEGETVLAGGVASRNGYLDYTSTNFGWFGFLPGVNLFQVDSASYDPSTVFTIQATPAWQ